jgi:primosomal protein N' (replication factor Y) (superfamily II helicase)
MFGFKKYVKVLLPFAMEQELVYGVPDEYLNAIQVGNRVEVQMGKNKIYAGLIIEIHTTASFPKIKPILSVLDEKPIISKIHLVFWEWISEYYLCSLGEVMQAALPALFKLDSMSEYIWTGEVIDESELNFEEWSLYKIFNIHQKLSVLEIKKYYTKSSITTLLSKWQKNGWIERVEVFSEKYKDKKEKYVILSELSNEDIDKTHASLTSDKQKEILEFLLIKQIEGEEKVTKKNLMAQEFSTSAYNTLIKKGFLIELEEKVDRVSSENKSEILPLELSVFQTQIYQEIKSSLSLNKPYLLFGVTASGKTMIYIKMALDAIVQGKQVLWLLPEIALTTQIIDKVRKYISKFLVFHSRFNNAEQAEIWEKVQEESSLLILGTTISGVSTFQQFGSYYS